MALKLPVKASIVLVMCFFCLGSYAQTKTSLSYYSDETLNTIGATSEQRVKIFEVQSNTNREISKVKNNQNLSEEEKKIKQKEIYSEGGKQYDLLINDEQKAIIKQLWKDIQDRNQKDGVEPVLDSTSYYNNYYQQRLELFSSFPPTANAIMFLGSSSAERGAWHELLPGFVISNRGIGGDNTLGVLARLDDVIASKPSKVFLFIGTNDLGSRAWAVDFVYNKYVQIINGIAQKSPKTKVYIVSLPINEKVITIERFKGKSIYLKQFNTKLKAFAKAENIVFVDFFDEVLGKNGELKEEYTTDGIHLTPMGYKLMVDYLKKRNYL